jgi:hypothetical protein
MSDELVALLEATSLSHLSASLNGVTLETLRLHERLALLAHLKQLGVARLGDRQKLATAVAKSTRAPPPAVIVDRPRVVCLHGTAGSERVLRMQLAKLLRNKGAEDVDFVFVDGMLTPPASSEPCCRSIVILSLHRRGRDTAWASKSRRG